MNISAIWMMMMCWCLNEIWFRVCMLEFIMLLYLYLCLLCLCCYLCPLELVLECFCVFEFVGSHVIISVLSLINGWSVCRVRCVYHLLWRILICCWCYLILSGGLLQSGWWWGTAGSAGITCCRWHGCWWLVVSCLACCGWWSIDGC